MGEIADSILEGEMCQICGEWMDFDEPPGYPVTCAGCKGSEPEDDDDY